MRQDTQLLVVFEDRPQSRWLRILRTGFRHCFLLRRTSGGWLGLEAHMEGFEATLLADIGLLSLVRHLVSRQAAVIGLAARPRPAPLRFPPAPFTCVELVKRTLGIADPRVLTPWQLYRHLHGDPARTLAAHSSTFS